MESMSIWKVLTVAKPVPETEEYVMDVYAQLPGSDEWGIHKVYFDEELDAMDFYFMVNGSTEVIEVKKGYEVH